MRAEARLVHVRGGCVYPPLRCRPSSASHRLLSCPPLVTLHLPQRPLVSQSQVSPASLCSVLPVPPLPLRSVLCSVSALHSLSSPSIPLPSLPSPSSPLWPSPLSRYSGPPCLPSSPPPPPPPLCCALPCSAPFLAAVVLPVAVVATAEAPTSSTELSTTNRHSLDDSFQCRLREAEGRVDASVSELARSDAELSRLLTETASLSRHHLSLERRLQWIHHQLSPPSSSSSSSPSHSSSSSRSPSSSSAHCDTQHCSSELQRLAVKAAELSSLLSSSASQLACIHTEAGSGHGGRYGEAIRAQEQLLCRAQRLLDELRSSSRSRSGSDAHCDDDDDNNNDDRRKQVEAQREALLQQLERLLGQLCTGQASLTSSLSALRRDVDALACQLSSAEALWQEVSRLFSALLLCRREAKELRFLDWAEQLLAHFECTAREAHHSVRQLQLHTHSLQGRLDELLSVLQRLLCTSASSPHALTSTTATATASTTTATCTPHRLDSIAAFLRSLHALIVDLQQRADGADAAVHRAIAGLRALQTALAAVERLGCEVEAVIRQWRQQVVQQRAGGEGAQRGAARGQGKGEGKEESKGEREGKAQGQGQDKGEQECDKQEEQWKQAVLRGLAEMGKALDCIRVQEGAVVVQLAEVQCVLDEVDGCGLVRVEGRGLSLAGVSVSV